MKSKQKRLPSVFSREFAERAFSNADEKIDLLDPSRKNGLETCGCRFKLNGVISHYFFVSDDEKDVVYFFQFESPAAKWNENANIGHAMMKNIILPVERK